MSKTNSPTSNHKPALILIHGFRGSPLGLQNIAHALENAGYPVHTPPIPPFAGVTMHDYNQYTYADYIADYIINHRLDRPVLIGHSMGSLVATATASLRPNIVNQKLVLLSPISSKTARPFAVISPLSAYLPRRSIDFITTAYLHVPHGLQEFQNIMQTTHACSNDHPPKRADVLQSAKFSTRYAVGDFRLDKEVLLIAGEHDHLIRKKSTIKLAEKLSAQTNFLPETGHLHNYEKPQETVQAILDFLNPDSNFSS